MDIKEQMRDFSELSMVQKRDRLIEIFGTKPICEGAYGLSDKNDSPTGILLADISIKKKKYIAGVEQECRECRIINYANGTIINLSGIDSVEYKPNWFLKSRNQKEDTIIAENQKYAFIIFTIRVFSDNITTLTLNSGNNSIELLSKEEEEIIEYKRKAYRIAIDSKIKELREHINQIREEVVKFDSGEYNEKLNKISELIDKKKNEIKIIEKSLSDRIEELKKLSENLRNLNEKGKTAEAEQAQKKLDEELLKTENAVFDNNLSFSELTERVKKYIKAVGFTYSDKQKIIERFLSRLYTGQIIILSGPPGTGKTSLPRLVAEAVGAKLHLISVQSDWTDAQDLLGFFDYAHVRYAATPFLDALRDAANDSHRMHFVMLDEMNLSHIEYYFSAVLSALEADRKLRLFGNSVKDTSDNPWPPEFIIPKNVQFIGTLNMDDTTRRPSPKVLDRSYVIEINEAEDIPEDENGVKTGENSEETKPFILAPDYFDPERSDYAECFKTDEGKVKEMLSALKSIAFFENLDDNDKRIIKESRLSLSLSARAIKQAERMLRQGADIDAVVCGKLLVTAKSGNMIEDEAKLVGVLTANLEKNKPILEDTNLTLKKNYLTDWSISKQKIEKMIQDNEIDYWR